MCSVCFFCPHNPKHLTLVFPMTKVWQCLQKSPILGWIFSYLLEAQSSVGNCGNWGWRNTRNWWKLTSGFLPAHSWFFPLSKSLLQRLWVCPHNFRLVRIPCRIKIPIFFLLLIMGFSTWGLLGNYLSKDWMRKEIIQVFLIWPCGKLEFPALTMTLRRRRRAEIYWCAGKRRRKPAIEQTLQQLRSFLAGWWWFTSFIPKPGRELGEVPWKPIPFAFSWKS